MADSVAYSYQDFKHPTYQEILRAHSYSTIKLVRNVSEFILKMSAAHEDFSHQVQNVVETYQQKNVELKNERGPLISFSSSLCDAYDALLDRTYSDTQAQLEMADLLRTSVGKPLAELATHKHNQLRKLFGFRENCQAIIAKAEDNLIKAAKSNVDSYQAYCSNKVGRDSDRLLTSYHLSHNDYALQLRAANSYEETYHSSVLPFILQEVQDLQMNLLDRLKEALDTYTMTISSKAVERGLLYEGLQPGSTVNSRMDQSNFLSAILKNPISGQYAPKQHVFNPPSVETNAIPASKLAPLSTCDVIVSGQTEKEVKARRLSLQREAAELTSYVKQNQDVVQALSNLSQRDLSNRQYGKLYEIEKDICRKSAETRLAQLQLTAIKAKLEVMALRQNGTGTMTSADTKGKRSTNAVKSMWKNAFRNLVKDEDQDAEEKTRLEKEKEAGTSSDSVSPKMSAVSALRKIATKRTDSKHSQTAPGECGGQQDQVEQVDPIYSLLKSAAGLPSQRTAARQVTDSTADSQPMSSANAAVTISADICDKESRLLGADQHGRLRRRGLAGGDRNRTGNNSHLHGSPDRRKVSFTHQRSYSCGDLSPTDGVKGWADENDDDWTHSGRVADDLTNQGLPLERGHRREPDVAGGQVRMKKDPTDRRKGWVKQKQKSKSFDFCWRSGMWSPVDEKNKVLIIVPTPRIGACKARLKLPSMFQMDSGSSYDSYEAAEAQQQQQQQQQQRPPVLLAHQKPQPRPVVLPEARLRRESNAASPAAERDRRRPSPNRIWLLHERKSHSLDSSFDDRGGYHRHEDLTPGNPAVAGYTNVETEWRGGVVPGGIRATVRDKRLRLLHRRKSRSLDMYEPGGETDQRRHRFRDRGSGSPFHVSPIRGQYLNEAVSLAQTHRIVSDAPHRPDVFSRSSQHGEAFVRRNDEEGWTADGPDDRRQRRRPSEFLSERTAERVNIVVREFKSPSPKDHHKTPSPRDLRSSPIESSPREAGGWKDPRMSLFRDAYAAKEKAAGHAGAGAPTASCDRRGLNPGRRETGEESPLVDRERRTTFAEQKSFSYDVPSLQVRPEIQHRKQSEPIVGSCGLPPRSRGRLLPRLPIEESELGKHISQIFRFNQSFDVLQLRSACPSLAAMGAAKTGSSAPPQPPLVVKPPVEIEVTIEEVDDKPPESSSDDTDRRKSFSEQKSFSYEVNEYFQYEQGDGDAIIGGEVVTVASRMRDYLDDNELRQFHVDSKDLKDDVIYDGEVVHTRRCRAMSQALVLGGKRKGFADQKSFSYELASNPKHRACLVASARQRVLAVQGAKNPAFHYQLSTERERSANPANRGPNLAHKGPHPVHQEKSLSPQAKPNRDQQGEMGRRRKSIYEECRSGSGVQRQMKPESDSGEDIKAASKPHRPILEKTQTINRHLECPRKETRRLSLAANMTGTGGGTNHKSTTATVSHQRRPEAMKRAEEVRCLVTDQRFQSGDPTREPTNRRSSIASEARKKSLSTESKKTDCRKDSEDDTDATAKSKRTGKQGGPSHATNTRLLDRLPSTEYPPMSTLQIPTNTSHRAQHKQKHQPTTGDIRGKARASSPPPGDQVLKKPKDETNISYFLSHKQQNALELSMKTDKKKYPETGESRMATSCEVSSEKEKERLLSTSFEKERPLLVQPEKETGQTLSEDTGAQRDRKVPDDDTAKPFSLKGRPPLHWQDTLSSTQSPSTKSASLLQLPPSKYREVFPSSSATPCRVSPTATACSSSSNIGDDGDLVSDGVVTWRRKSPDVGEMIASKKSSPSNRHPVRVETDYEGDRRDAFAHQKSFSYDVGTGQRSTDEHAPRGERMVQSCGSGPFNANSSPSSGWSRQFMGFFSARDKRVSMMDSKKSYSLDEYMTLQKQLQLGSREDPVDRSKRLSRQAQKTSVDRPHQVQVTPRRSPSNDEVRDSLADSAQAEGSRSPATTPQRGKLLLLHSMKALQDSEELTRAPDDGSSDSPPDSVKGRSRKPGSITDVQEREEQQRRKTSRLPIARFFGKLKMDRRTTDRDGCAEQRL